MSSPIDNLPALLSQLKSVATKATEAPKDLMDIITQAFDRMVQGATRNLGVSFISKLGSQGITSQFESQGYAAKMVNEGAGTLSARGGALAELITGDSGLGINKLDFSKLVASAVEPMQQMEFGRFESIPIEALGSLQPMSTPSLRGGEGMAMA